ncbi:MAG: TauD/TfdA family dioxygenase [Planctomycetota bacterium]
MTTSRSAPWRGDELFDHEGWGAPVDALPPSRAAEILEDGSGALLLRTGWTGDAATLEQRFLALTSELGTPVSQSADGARVLHVRDEGFAPGDRRFRGPYSNRRLAFHTDRCDVIAFLCVRPARSGGENHVLSSLALRDALRATDPAAAAVLERDALPYLRHVVDEGNERPYTLVPVFTEHEGRFAGSLLRVLVDRADASPNAPDLTAEQRAALDALEEVAEDPTLYASFHLEAGDVLLLNNWTTFHRRTAFEDDPDPARRRHLMRIWLSMPNSRALDPRFADHFGAIEAGALRGGMKARHG